MQIINSYILPAATFVLGLITKHLFDLYRNKISKIQYSINKSFLGVSGEDNRFGKVQVIYNDNIPVQNLYLCNIVLVNTSNRDFNDIEFTVWCDTDSLILISHAHKTNSINPINLTQQFVDQFTSQLQVNPNLVMTRRPYVVSVLNRDDSLTFSCLVTNNKGQVPNIYLDCEHEGLKLVPNFIQPQLFWGENQAVAAWCGLIICAIFAALLSCFITTKWLLIPTVYLLGALCLIPGVIILKVCKRIRKLLR